LYSACLDAWSAASQASNFAYLAAGDQPQSVPEQTAQADLLRCIVGPLLFRAPPAVHPAWLGWNGGTVLHLAQAIYDERSFDRLPVLADALEEAGSDNEELLSHCRGLGPHARGCWVLDVLLGKG